MTRISVITATYNCAETISDCLASVDGQSHLAREHIVIDGASRDGTLAVIERSQAKLSTLISEPDDGIYDALNKGIAQAKGDVIGFLHADDLFGDIHALSRIAAAFSDSDVIAAYGDLVYVAKDDPSRIIRYWRAGEFGPKRLRMGWMPPHPTLYVRRSVYEDLGGFNPGFTIAADYDFMLRLFRADRGLAVYLPHVLVRMRLGGVSNRSLRNVIRKSAEDFRAIRSNDVGGLGTLALKNLLKLSQFVKRPDVLSF